jgi:glycosyltransferase involved in cell wall biosynthesis
MQGPHRLVDSSESPVVVLVCFPFSVHAARWVNLLRQSSFRVVVFPSVIQPHCPELRPYRNLTRLSDVDLMGPGDVGVIDNSVIEVVVNSEEDRALGYVPMQSYADVTPEITPSPASLVSVLRQIRPALLHSLELQHGAYLCLEACRRMRSDFPRWLASSWGSDIYLYRKMKHHVPVLRELFNRIDGLHADCARDLDLAVELGFRGRHFPVVSGAGGADLSCFPDPASLPPPSRRNVIILKGNHGWSGRGLNVLLAVHRIAPSLRQFRIRVTHSNIAVHKTVEALANEDGLDIGFDPYFADHASAISRLAEARLVVAAGISDGASMTLLESMTVGTFCIQSDTSCAREWIIPGKTGFVVSPHDVAGLAAAIEKAATDDDLVDKAAVLNRTTIVRRWSTDAVKPIVIRGYQELIGSPETHRA